jgi:predicted amino acid racemase
VEAIETNYTTPTLPLHIAKVMKPLILGRDAGHSPYVTCISARPIDGGTQYIATNGHVMLMIDTTEPRPGLEHAAWSAEQVKTYIESKGHSPLVSDASLVHSLPAYDQVIPTGEPSG